MSEGLEILLLGELGVVRAGRAIALPASKKTRALLGYLAITGRAHTREELCDLLWQGPDDPRAALRWSLTKLRGVLGSDVIEADRERIALRSVNTDLGAVRAMLSGGVASVGVAQLESARARFRGEVLEGLSLPDCYRFHEWSTAERDLARSLRLAVLKALMDHSASNPEAALGWAREKVAIDPLAEGSHIAVIEILAALGRRRDALAQYETCSRILEQEAGARPSPALLEAKMRIGSVSVAAPAPRPEAPIPKREAPPPFVGRDKELELVRRVVHGGEKSVLLFLGEPGIGKSRLLDELGTATRRLGGLVLAGRAFEAEMVRPYGPWIDALSAVTPARVPPALRDELGALLPALGSDSATAQNRVSLFDAVVRLIIHLSEVGGPVAILLDDVQWFDEATAALLHFAARKLEGARVAIACAARPGELSDNPAALRLVRALARSGRSHTLELGPLEPEALATLARAVAPGVDAGRVVHDSSGNPLFALELTRAIGRGDDSVWDSIGGLIGERVLRLEEPARELLGWAAALGTRFDLQTLERVTGGSPLEIGSRIAELERHGIVRASNDGTAYDFVHDLVRAGAYRQLSEPRRRGVHRNIARALEAMDTPDRARAGDVAHHAALGGDAELAARSALAAAQRCLRMFAGAEAARLAESGLQHLSALSRREQSRLHLSFLSVLVFSRTGTTGVERLKDELNRAITRAEDAGLHAEVVEGIQALSVLQYDGGDLGGAHETMLRAVAARQDGDPITRARHLGNTARCFALLERDMDQAHTMYAEARALADHAGARVGAVEWAGAILLTFAGDDTGALPLFQRVLSLARAEEDRWVEYECLRALVQLELESTVPLRIDYCRELLGVAELMSEGSEGPVARALEALLRLHRGDPSSAVAVEEALAALRAVDAKGMLAYTLTFAAEADIASGRFSDAERRATEALRAAGAVSRRSHMALARVILARAALARGDESLARTHLDATKTDFDKPLTLNARARAAVARLSAALS